MSHACSRVIGLVLIVLGCGSQPEALIDAQGSCELNVMTKPAMGRVGHLELLACPVRSELPVGEPVEVVIVIRNGDASARTVNSHLVLGTWIDAEITGPDGERVAASGDMETGFEEAEADVLLPPAGFIGRTLDLSCALNDYSPASARQCAPLYAFDERGTYHVTMTFSYLCEGFECPAGRPEVTTLRSEPFEIRIR